MANSGTYNRNNLLKKNKEIREKTLSKLVNGIYRVYDDVNPNLGTIIDFPVKEPTLNSYSYGDNGIIGLYGNIDDIGINQLNHNDGGFNEIDNKIYYTTNAKQNSSLEGSLPLMDTLQTRDKYYNDSILKVLDGRSYCNDSYEGDYEEDVESWMGIKYAVREINIRDNACIESTNKQFYSRGRALKTKVVGEVTGKQDCNFCRSWTRTTPYSKFSDTIRPFKNKDGFLSLKDLQGKYGKMYRPNDGGTRLNDMSVLQSNGLVNITPKKQRGSNELDKESIKKCMFSIENLAWRDVKTPSLKESQKGPNNGRIMWFPPYNLRFNESISTQWQDNTFIGRGEKIYSYVNTERNGTLSFTLLIDHPSLINKYNINNNVDNDSAEQNILRFFAGCDSNLGISVKDVSKTNVTEKISSDAKESGEEIEIVSYIFFPNNYSGVDDKPEDCMKYLYDGNGLANCGYESDNIAKLNSPITGAKCDGKIRQWEYKVDNDYRNQCISPKNYENTTTFKLNTTLAYAGNENSGNTFTFKELYDALNNKKEGRSETLHNILFEQGKITSIECVGNATSNGYKEANSGLSISRAETVIKWLKKNNIKCEDIKPNSNINIINNKNVNTQEYKEGLRVKVIFKIQPKENALTNKLVGTNSLNKNTSNKNTKTTQQINYLSGYSSDDEYLYFSKITEQDSLTRDNIMEKVRVFTPAFHSITPEGFNSRLTFLQQCTRQGPSYDKGGIGVSNMAFGRAPYCVLRIGDFFNTKIVIDSVTIDYGGTGGGVLWDLNPEGVGVQPMFADVSINFKFIGGTDISGPISRLQNAVSFNYYSNASIYDERADYRKNFDAKVQYKKQELETNSK